MDKEIQILDFLIPLKKRLWLIIILTGISTVLTGFYYMSTWTPVYQSSAKILLPTNMNRPEFFSTMGVIAKDPLVLDQVVAALDLNRPTSALSGQVSFSNENGSQVVRISVVDESQALAANIANTTANVFIKEIGNTLQIYNAKIFSEAKVDEQPQPINVNPRYNMEIGFVVGLVLSIGVALFLDVLNRKIQSELEIEKALQVPLLGTVSKMNGRNTTQKNYNKIRSLAKGGSVDGYKRTSSL